MKRFLVVLLLCLLPAVGAAAGPAKPGERAGVPVGKQERCPVCGMFVAKFPDFAARIRIADNQYAAFDGAKDMFKGLFDPSRYFPGKKASDVAAVWVTDYYQLAAIDGRQAFYVVGSDVYGPMGKELIPFASEADAREFKKDHKGTALFRFRTAILAACAPTCRFQMLSLYKAERLTEAQVRSFSARIETALSDWSK